MRTGDAACGRADCPFSDVLNDIMRRLEKIDERQVALQADIVAIKAGSVQDRRWQSAVMWFFGILASGGLIIWATLRGHKGA